MRHHTNCSVEFRGGKKFRSPHITESSMCGRRSSDCRNHESVHVCPGHQDSGTSFGMVLKHDSVKPPLINIIYNIKWVCLKHVSSSENDTVVRDLTFSLPRPRPPQGPQTKTIHNLPKTSPIKTSSSTNNDRVLSPSRPRISGKLS